MFSTLHSDINSLKSGLLHLTGQPNSQRGPAKVGDGIEQHVLDTNAGKRLS
jgi:hypothetical protein